jgi:ABC-type transport system involved in multi-copper enzyme maturation permease subunit
VRLQSNFTRDTAGLPGTVSADSPRWLRLTRSGDVITGYDSVDGTRWVKVGSARLTGLPTTAQAGLFVASPEYEVTSQHVGGGSTTGGSTVATAVFDRLDARGLPPGGRWTYDRVGDTPGPGGPLAQDVPAASSFQESGGRFTVSGSGNIAPAVSDGGNAVEHTLAGAFAGLIVVIVLGTLFVTAEYRRGLIRTTLAASPRRGRVLAAKALVIAAVTFTAGLVAAVVALAVGKNILRSNGIELYPVTTLTQLRLVAGTAALLAVTAVLALAVGTVLRRSAGAVTGVIVLVVLPYILAVASVLPTGSARWLLRLTPAAAFAVQQSLRQYPQVDHLYAPLQGYFPLSPWAGFAVLCAYAALALGIAVVLLRRRDA